MEQEPSAEHDPDEKLRKAANAMRAEYERRVEAGELDPGAVSVDRLQEISEEGRPITRRDLGRQAIVLSALEFARLRYLDLVLSIGEEARIHFQSVSWHGPEHRFIVFPDDLA